ncbi:MAG: response regulator [Isosphaeraceae bacterium]|nr:response regulator [Isosphaeraceae bacterium]
MSEVPTSVRPGSSTWRPALRILLADDNRAFRVATRKLLRNQGHFVDEVADGRRAVKAAIHKQYDMLFINILLNDIGGLKAATLLREYVPGPRRPKLIAVTAGPPAGDERWYVAAGMDDFLVKPLSLPRLAQLLDRLGAPARPVASRLRADIVPVARKTSRSGEVPAPGGPIEVVVDGLLCALRVWSEHEWASIPESERPVAYVFQEGLGWVGAVPKIVLN